MITGSFKDLFVRFASRNSENESATIILQSAILPIISALFGVITPQLWGINALATVVAWSALLVVYCLVFWKSYHPQRDIYSLLLKVHENDEELHRMNDEIETYKNVVLDLEFKNMISFAMRAMSYEYIKAIKNGNSSKDYICEMIDELLSLFYHQGDEIFGFLISEKWSIAVYIYDDEASLLRCIWRRTSRSHPSFGSNGRDWIPGEGHVGKAFLDRRPIFTGNANEDSVAQLCRARTSRRREHDDETYVSFASVPISIANDDDVDPHGVLVVTSNLEGRLADEAVTELLMHVAQTLALILEISGVSANCILGSNHCMTDGDEGEQNGEKEREYVDQNS